MQVCILVTEWGNTMCAVETETVLSTIDLAKYNGMITIHNPRTGNHRIFRITTVRKGNLEGKRIVSLLTGSDNLADYQGFGFVSDSGQVTVWRKHRGTPVEPSAFDKFARILNFPEHFSSQHSLDYMFSVKCRVCNRTLTTPESIESGIGPVCSGRSA